MTEYYYNLPGTQEKAGPVSEATLRAGAKNGTYPPDTLVWCQGMAEWLPLYRVFPSSGLPPTPAETMCPPKHLVGAVVLTILNFLCFPPFCIVGIVAIVKACNVEPLWRQGRWEEATRASRAARALNRWSLFLWLLPFILLGIVFISLLQCVSPSF